MTVLEFVSQQSSDLPKAYVPKFRIWICPCKVKFPITQNISGRSLCSLRTLAYVLKSGLDNYQRGISLRNVA